MIERGQTLVDLGAGHCLFSEKARLAGYKVTAVDGRHVRVPENLDPAITFVRCDVRDFPIEGYDIVCILGLLYHLTLDDQIDLLRRCAGATVIIDTQVHVAAMVTDAAGTWAEKVVVTPSGYEGVVFPENDNVMASIGNLESFWHTEASLLRLYEGAGFAHLTSIEPAYASKYGARKFYVLR